MITLFSHRFGVFENVLEHLETFVLGAISYTVVRKSTLSSFFFLSSKIKGKS